MHTCTGSIAVWYREPYWLEFGVHRLLKGRYFLRSERHFIRINAYLKGTSLHQKAVFFQSALGIKLFTSPPQRCCRFSSLSLFQATQFIWYIKLLACMVHFTRPDFPTECVLMYGWVGQWCFCLLFILIRRALFSMAKQVNYPLYPLHLLADIPPKVYTYSSQEKFCGFRDLTGTNRQWISQKKLLKCYSGCSETDFLLPPFLNPDACCDVLEETRLL